MTTRFPSSLYFFLLDADIILSTITWDSSSGSALKTENDACISNVIYNKNAQWIGYNRTCEIVFNSTSSSNAMKLDYNYKVCDFWVVELKVISYIFIESRLKSLTINVKLEVETFEGRN